MSPRRPPNNHLTADELELLRSVVRKRQPQLIEAINGLEETPLTDSQGELLREILATELMATGLQTNDEPNERGLQLEHLSDRVVGLVALPPVLRGPTNGKLYTLAAERGEHTLVVVFKMEAPWQAVLGTLEPFNSRAMGAIDLLFQQVRSVFRVDPQGHPGYKLVFRRQSTDEERATVKQMLEASPWVLGVFEDTPVDAITADQLDRKTPLDAESK